MSAEMLARVGVCLAIVGGAAQMLVLRRVAERICQKSLPVARGLRLLALSRTVLVVLTLLSFAGGLRVGLAMLGAYWLSRSGTLLVASLWRLDDYAT